MDTIDISDLEVAYHIGVPDAERANPQRLLLNLRLQVDISKSAATDSVADTINYQSIVDDLLAFGHGRSWKLLETLVTQIADHILIRYRPIGVTVEARKFIIPQTRYVSVTCTRPSVRRNLCSPAAAEVE